jgi:hypothetical protein
MIGLMEKTGSYKNFSDETLLQLACINNDTLHISIATHLSVSFFGFVLHTAEQYPSPFASNRPW